MLFAFALNFASFIASGIISTPIIFSASFAIESPIVPAPQYKALGLEAGATKQDALIAAMFARAIEAKDVQAFNSLRDTAGEKPSDKLDASITAITPADEELIKRVAARLPENGNR